MMWVACGTQATAQTTLACGTQATAQKINTLFHIFFRHVSEGRQGDARTAFFFCLNEKTPSKMRAFLCLNGNKRFSDNFCGGCMKCDKMYIFASGKLRRL
jgi:hypothetical protein